MNFHYTLLIFIVFFFICGCQNSNDKIFTIRHGEDVGIDFQNTIVANDTFNALAFEYIYNGSGVGVGDFNNDGFDDLFFGGNQVSSELYLNKGDLSFSKITKEAGVTTSRWITGVSVIDINKDGWNDIYLCVGGFSAAEERQNILFINQGLRNGIPVFVEMAKEYGLNDDSYSTMAAFLDYDKDGDLDMYLVNNWLERYNRNNLRPKRIKGEAESTDNLYRNNGDNTFSDVSSEAGILIEGYGLGVNICDINEDTWPDIYVSNDFMSNDLFWINQRDGTFKNKIGEFLKHQTHNGMGVDIADFNNDEKADIMVVDMLPPGHIRQKMMTSGQNYDHFHMSIDMGYEPQYMRNTLQLNRGKTEDGKVLFSEIAFMAGVAQTDWSWAPLFADFDNDGFKDLFIGNGYRKDVTNLDFIFFAMDNNPFGTTETRSNKMGKELEQVPEVKLSNYFYKNSGSLGFEDKTKAWGVDLPTFSNGAAYSDLDNDGDLDLIVNNIDQEVIVYENKTGQKKSNHYLRFKFKDESVLNQTVSLYTAGKVQYQEATPFRGFQSTVMRDVHFGLGTATIVDSVRISWPDSSVAVYYNIKADTTLTVSKPDTKKMYKAKDEKPLFYFTQVDLIDYTHQERSASDIKNTRTLLHELTRYGPCLAKGDVNGDKLDDLFIGGERGVSSKLFVQQKNEEFIGEPVTEDSTREDGDAIFFDADSDGDLDLYVASACPSSMEEPKPHKLYLNDGTGKFAFDANLPEIITSASCVIASDYDGDSDLDLFIGGTFKPRAYPYADRSYILNNEKGRFTDVTQSLHPELEYPGLISSALWTDINQDQKPDLVLAGEWMPIRVFINEGDKFEENTEAFGLEDSNGWWTCLKAADLNNDGSMDIIAGNTGKNSFFKPTKEEPVKIVAKDFDKNESMDPIITYYNPVEKDRFILHNRMVLIDQIPSVKRRFETFTQYASTPFDQSFTEKELEGAFNGMANSLASVILVNKQGRSFTMIELPETIQMSTLNDVAMEDLNGDGFLDLVGIGNNYAQETLFGRYNASIGTILMGDGNFNWKEMAALNIGFVADGDARTLDLINTEAGKLWVIGNHNGKLLTLKFHNSKHLDSIAEEKHTNTLEE